MDPGDPRPLSPAKAAARRGGGGAPSPAPAAAQPSLAASDPLCETFDGEADLDPRLAWLNRPAAATFSPSTGLRIVPLPTADWWCGTGRTPRAAVTDGALLGAPFTGAFDATAAVTMHHRQAWDQAGLMLHIGSDCWCKVSAERAADGSLVLATAVTNAGWTDLATRPLSAEEAGCEGGGGGGGGGAAAAPGVTARLHFRIRRAADGDVALAWAPGGSGPDLASPRPGGWRTARLAHLHADPGVPVRVGPYALAPTRAGFIANVRWFRVDTARGGVKDE